VGFARAGWAGLAVAGASFIVPAALITAAVAWAYVRFGTLPLAESLLAGVKPARGILDEKSTAPSAVRLAIRK
jgi:chromate transporter